MSGYKEYVFAFPFYEEKKFPVKSKKEYNINFLIMTVSKKEDEIEFLCSLYFIQAEIYVDCLRFSSEDSHLIYLCFVLEAMTFVRKSVSF